jgi:hypothetical protein
MKPTQKENVKDAGNLKSAAKSYTTSWNNKTKSSKLLSSLKKSTASNHDHHSLTHEKKMTTTP